MINFKAIGTRIKTERKLLSMTQEALAEQLEISTEHLSRIENGAYRPSLLLIERMSSVFGIEEEELMFGNAGDKNLNCSLAEKIEALSESKKKAILAIIDLISSDA